jgi:beta-glucuronidase
MKLLIFLLPITFVSLFLPSKASLYPRESETREIKSLDGIWKFQTSANPATGFDNVWYQNASKWSSNSENKIKQMPVPASFNDITVDANLRDFVGWAWYHRDFFVPNTWQDKVYVLASLVIFRH